MGSGKVRRVRQLGYVYHMPHAFKALLGRGQMCGPGYSLSTVLVTQWVAHLLNSAFFCSILKLCLQRLAASLLTTYCD